MSFNAVRKDKRLENKIIDQLSREENSNKFNYQIANFASLRRLKSQSKKDSEKSTYPWT
jgi:hypothetical protein